MCNVELKNNSVQNYITRKPYCYGYEELKYQSLL